jgi:manganese/zinc/iron transport system permease protein
MTFLQIDLPAILVAVLAALAAALVGNILVLRRQALMGDALSHMVLPGIVVGYMISGAAHSWAMAVGALVAGLLGAGLIAMVRRLGKLDPATAMGVVLTAMFAGGVLLLEAADASNVHLDVEHALYGSLESAIWLWPMEWGDIFDPAGWSGLPKEVPLLLAALVVLGLAFVVAFKEIGLTAFDPDYAVSLGLPGWTTELLINGAAALAVVAAFDAVGSILVIAMLICPAATARLLTDRFAAQVWASLAFAVLIAIGGYAFAAWGAPALGAPAAINAAGAMAGVGGLVLGLAAWRYRARKKQIIV